MKKKNLFLGLFILSVAFQSCKEDCPTVEPLTVTEQAEKHLNSFRFSNKNFENHVFLGYTADGEVNKFLSEEDVLTFVYGSNKIIEIKSGQKSYSINYSSPEDTIPNSVDRTEEDGLTFRITLEYTNEKLTKKSILPLAQPDNKFSSINTMSYNSDGTLRRFTQRTTDFNGNVTIDDSTTSIESDGRQNPFMVDKALRLYTAITLDSYFVGSQNITEVTMSDGGVITKTPKIDDFDRYIGYTETRNGNIVNELDLDF